uniref:Uncharacterized protein n=1 Tax=Myotis myotis TaxID=51298 RepID=A0A7J7TIX0_MYOMY|nr:hypothetical protein mMyoMyo1_001913 [Myotis myotis]
MRRAGRRRSSVPGRELPRPRCDFFRWTRWSLLCLRECPRGRCVGWQPGRIIIKNDEKIKRMNEAFVNIQKELAHFSQGLSLEPLQKQLALQPSQENRPVNVDEATRLMAQL